MGRHHSWDWPVFYSRHKWTVRVGPPDAPPSEQYVFVEDGRRGDYPIVYHNGKVGWDDPVLAKNPPKYLLDAIRRAARSLEDQVRFWDL